MPGAQSNLARRPASTSPAAFGSLPAATTTISLERALALSGVDETELALAYANTFHEARSLEELVSLVAETRRRGLDTLLRHVYYERFGGDSSGPSLHIGIDGLRAIAARTGRAAGKLEPRFTGVAGEVTEGGRGRTAPEKCVVTVYALVQGQKCAYDGVAWWDEAYPGDGSRGRMWRLRPRGMLAIAAERQALRAAFPAETSGLGDYDGGEEGSVLDAPPRQPPPPDMYARTLGAPNDLPEQPAAPTATRAHLRQAYDQLLEDALARGAVAMPDRQQWLLPLDATEQQITDAGRALRQVVETDRARVDVRHPLAQRMADLVQEAAAMEVEYIDCQVPLPAAEETVRRAIEQLDDRITDARRALNRLDAETAEALPLS
jgi:phage recombination protein Bet